MFVTVGEYVPADDLTISLPFTCTLVACKLIESIVPAVRCTVSQSVPLPASVTDRRCRFSSFAATISQTRLFAAPEERRPSDATDASAINAEFIPLPDLVDVTASVPTKFDAVTVPVAVRFPDVAGA